MRERIKPTRSGLFAIELLISVGLFVRAKLMSRDSAELSRAVVEARSAAECFKAAGGDMEEMARLTGGELAAGNALLLEYDEDWNKLSPGAAGTFELALAPAPGDSGLLVGELYDMAGRSMDQCVSTGDDDFSLSVPDVARFRVNAYRQRGSLAAVIRVVSVGIPDWKKMGIPEEVMKIAQMRRGMVLVTGPAGSGKSTTLACVVDAVNNTRSAHIITIEEHRTGAVSNGPVSILRTASRPVESAILGGGWISVAV